MHLNSLASSRICIILCTFNGEAYLKAQLDSIENQTHKDWIVVATDDGSHDKTLEILKKFQQIWGEEKLQIFEGLKMGFAKNFLNSLRNININANYFAYCDQDDIWLPHKLERALGYISSIADQSRPCLYCSRTIYISHAGDEIGESYIFAREPSFKNALVQCIAGGNTMVFNGQTREYLSKIKHDAEIVSHDWITYILVTGVGGHVYWDVKPTVLYRQHDGSSVGENRTLQARLNRVKKLLNGRYKNWVGNNLLALSSIAGYFTFENQKTFNNLTELRSGNIFLRLWGLYKSGIRRQTLFGNIALYLAAILKKI
jgi:glycosyltransferase involved in cell wall biosynthesis